MLKEQISKLLQQIKRLEHLMAKNTILKRRLVGLLEIERIKETNGELVEKKIRS